MEIINHQSKWSWWNLISIKQQQLEAPKLPIIQRICQLSISFVSPQYGNEQRQTSLQFCLHPEPPRCFAAKNLLQISIEYGRIKRKSRPSLSQIELEARKFMIKLSLPGFQNHISAYCSAAREYCLVPAGRRTASRLTVCHPSERVFAGPVRRRTFWLL